MKPSMAMNVQALVKGDQRYIVMWRDGRSSEAAKQLGDWASDPELDFNWYDAAVLATAIRNAEGMRR